MPVGLTFCLDHLTHPEGGQKGEEPSELRAVSFGNGRETAPSCPHVWVLGPAGPADWSVTLSMVSENLLLNRERRQGWPVPSRK